MLPKDRLTICMPRPAWSLLKRYARKPRRLVPETLGGHLKNRRLELKLTLKQVAAHIGVSLSVIKFWEDDCYLPSDWRRDRVVAFIGYDPTVVE